jgi:uncharacterized protein YjbJ (UPF0337 family)
MENPNDSTSTPTLKAPETLETESSKSSSSETLMGRFAKTSTAAKLSGTFHETAGLLKLKFGEFKDDASLKTEGRNERLLGKVHQLVGEVREFRELGAHRVEKTGAELQKIVRTYASNMLDETVRFLGDVKKTIF